jgi:hypothetical protein
MCSYAASFYSTAANQEDLELENAELASKLAELTTQAKKMLLNNESLEEEIQDQQVEYEDRIAELEKYSAELECKLAEKIEEHELLLLHQEHGAALNKIEKSSPKNDTIKELTIGLEHDENRKHIGEESSELHECDDIISELKAKNEIISNLLQLSHEQNDAAADFISCLKSDNAKLRKIISEHGKISKTEPTTEAHDDCAIDFTEQVELQYRSTLVQTAICGSPGPSQRRLWDTPASPAIETTPGSSSNQCISSSLVSDMKRSTSYVPAEHSSTALPRQIIQQIENLTIENGKLAQRLGNAVADKECKKKNLISLYTDVMCFFYLSLLSQLHHSNLPSALFDQLH